MPPKIIEEKSTINPEPITEGETLNLYCHVDGSPKPKVTWYFRKNAAFNEAIGHFHRNNTIVYEGDNLIIHNVSRHYSGYFECVANNSVHPAASRKIKVAVECKI